MMTDNTNTGADTMTTNEDTNNNLRLAAKLWDEVKDFGNFTLDVFGDNDRVWRVNGRCGFLDAVRVSDTVRGLLQTWNVTEAAGPGGKTVWSFPGLGKVTLRFREDADNFLTGMMTGTLDLIFWYDRDLAKWGDNA